MSKIFNSIRIGVIGLGKMGMYHLNALKSLQKGEFENYYKGDSRQILSKLNICGVCDTIPGKYNYAENTEFFDDYHNLIENAAADIIVIATPTKTHFKIAEFALEKNINLFVEKPIVTESWQFSKLIETANRNGLKIMAGHIERYNPVSLKLREYLNDNGNMQAAFNFARTQRHAPRIDDDIIIDKLIHDLDLSLFLFGPIESYEILDHKKYKDTVYELTLRTKHRNGTGKIFVSWLEYENIRREISLTFGGKSLHGDFLNKTLKIDDNFIQCDVPRWIESQNNQVKDELVDFIVHCFSRKENLPGPLLTIDDIGATVKIIEKICKSLNK